MPNLSNDSFALPAELSERRGWGAEATAGSVRRRRFTVFRLLMINVGFFRAAFKPGGSFRSDQT
jgi:hypothetical protein